MEGSAGKTCTHARLSVPGSTSWCCCRTAEELILAKKGVWLAEHTLHHSQHYQATSLSREQQA